MFDEFGKLNSNELDKFVELEELSCNFDEL